MIKFTLSNGDTRVFNEGFNGNGVWSSSHTSSLTLDGYLTGLAKTGPNDGTLDGISCGMTWASFQVNQSPLLSSTIFKATTYTHAFYGARYDLTDPDVKSLVPEPFRSNSLTMTVSGSNCVAISGFDIYVGLLTDSVNSHCPGVHTLTASIYVDGQLYISRVMTLTIESACAATTMTAPDVSSITAATANYKIGDSGVTTIDFPNGSSAAACGALKYTITNVSPANVLITIPDSA